MEKRTVNGQQVEVEVVTGDQLRTGDLVCNDLEQVGLDNRVVTVRRVTELQDDWEVEVSDGTEWQVPKRRGRVSRLTGLVPC